MTYARRDSSDVKFSSISPAKNLNINESGIGIAFYISKTPGIGGEIKTLPENFFVEEVSRLPEIHEDGNYAVLKVKKKNWGTLNFARVLSKILQISQKRVEYAGTKDKKAVTIQYFTISKLNQEQISKLNSIEIKDAEIEFVGNIRRPLQLGDLIGNKFRIIIEKTKGSDDNIKSVLSEIKEKGVPNYFGPQRFGTLRFITHEVGKFILKKDFENAFWIYVAKPFEGESEDMVKIRKELWEKKDPKIGLKDFPNYLRYEKSLLQKLREGLSEEKALLSLPKNLKLMFVHAYQGYIFNRLVSDRIKEFKTLKTVEEGDYADFTKPELDDYPSLMETYSKLNKRNNERINFLIKQNRAYLALPIPGYCTEIGEDWASKKVISILEEDNISLEDFKNKYKEFSSKGEYRVADMPFSSFEFDTSFEDSRSIFSFFLPKGCYATSFLREFMKT